MIYTKMRSESGASSIAGAIRDGFARRSGKARRTADPLGECPLAAIGSARVFMI